MKKKKREPYRMVWTFAPPKVVVLVPGPLTYAGVPLQDSPQFRTIRVTLRAQAVENAGRTALTRSVETRPPHILEVVYSAIRTQLNELRDVVRKRGGVMPDDQVERMMRRTKLALCDQIYTLGAEWRPCL